MNYLQEGMVVSAIGVVRGMPIFFLITGAAIFSIVCLANWHKEFHKKVNFYLSGGYVNEESAAARAEETLQFLSGALIFLSGIIIFLVFV